MIKTCTAIVAILACASLSTADIYNRQVATRVNPELASSLAIGQQIYARANNAIFLNMQAIEQCILSATQALISQQTMLVGAVGELTEIDKENRDKIEKLDKDIKEYTYIFENDKTLGWDRQDSYYYQAELWKLEKKKILDQFRSGKNGLENADISDFQNKLAASRKDCKAKLSAAIVKTLDEEEGQIEMLLKRLRTDQIEGTYDNSQDKRDLAELTLGAVSVLAHIQEKGRSLSLEVVVGQQ